MTRHRTARASIGASAVVAVMVLGLVAASPAGADGFIRGIVITVDGEAYYLEGPPDGPEGARDVPGHYWVKTGPTQLEGQHFNTGPFGAERWWSSVVPDGRLLYMVHGIVDTWSLEKARRYAQRGHVHYHELVNVSDGSLHPSKVVWLKHTAVTSFTLDGGPRPELAHAVSPGIDFDFIPNAMVPYP